MSPRKKNTGKSGPFNQSTINTFFSAKSKHASTSTRPKRLAQSSLTARPLRSKRSPDPEEILDLTHSTSPVREPESPPSAKKRKLRATSPDQSPISGAEEDSSPMSRSTSPALRNTTEPGPSTSVQPMSVSPAPSQTGRSHTMLDIDPDEVVESSQTQYLNVWFTPSSQRTFHMDLGRVPAPVFAPVSTRTSQEGQEPSPARETPGPSNPTEESQPTAFIPSSQGEVSEPYTPKKRNRTWLDQSGTDTQVPSGAMPPSAQEPNIIDRLAGTSKRQRSTNGIPAPAHAVWASTPINNRVGPVNPFTPHFSSPQPIPSPMYPSGRSDMIPSSQGEPSLEATEMGTVESPPKTAKYPADAIVPTFRVPPPAPIVQDTLHTRPRATTPLMPISNININAPRTPQRAVEQVPSSPSDFPSPGRLMSSLGFEGPRATKNVPLPDERSTALSEVNGVEKCTRPHALSAPPCPEDGADDRVPKATDSQAYGEDSPARSQSSSQTVVPSSQPIHDSSPPPDYDLDPQRHAFNQGRLQSFNQPPVEVQPPAGFDSRFPSNSSRPYFTAQTHQSPSSSQSLPPSQSPIKGGRFDPNLSAAGVRGVFGMLGFGSEADSHEAQTGQRQGNNVGGNDSHTPVAYDLPPSSPPPQTPTRHESRESSPDSYLVPASGRKGKAKSRKGKTPIRDSPLVRAFEDAKKRSKATSSVRRAASKIAHPSPMPSPHPDDMEVDSSPVRDSKPRSKRPTRKTGAQSPSSRRASLAKAPMRAQRQKSVDQDIVESSDAEEMEIDVQLPPTLPTSTRATAGAQNSAETTKSSSTITPGRNRISMRVSEERAHAPATPAQERLPSSVSPSPIRVRRYSSPPPENTQTQDEAETPWESLRPSQSVSQVYERQLIEEAERSNRLRMEQNAEKQKAKVLVEESPDMPNNREAEVDRTEPREQEEESPDQEPVRPVTISLDPRSPTNVPSQPPHLVLPQSFSTPRTRRTTEKAHYIVTPTKVIKRTPVITPSRKSLTPSSMAGEDDPDEEYTYVEETFNPTESQQSFLNRILQGNNSQLG